jgi:hypothetical protein
MAGLDPAIPLRLAPRLMNRDHRDSAPKRVKDARERAYGAGPVMTLGWRPFPVSRM